MKLLSRDDPQQWLRYFPTGKPVWKGCEFVFDRDACDYDWLVVHEDVPPGIGGARKDGIEPLACAAANTLLITAEPEAVKAYGSGFCAQFGHVLTSQPAWALPHPNRHYTQAANKWFYGAGIDQWMTRDALERGPDLTKKTRELSVVHSNKRQTHTLHARRYDFIESVRRAFPDIQVFGHGARALPDKADALDTFRYHLAVENHIGLHHITEKLTDAYLGCCLPFYVGAPNAADYFPADSFIALDIHRPEAALEVIRQTLVDDLWPARLEAIREARRRVIEDYHLFAKIDAIIQSVPRTISVTNASGLLLSRHAWRARHPVGALWHVVEKTYVRSRSILAQRKSFARFATSN